MAKQIDLDTIQDRLKTWFEKKMPQAEELSILLEKDTVGGSNETFFLDLRYQEAGQRKIEKLVIRWPPKGFTTLHKYDMKEQFLIFKNLGNTAVPAPAARWLEEDESVIGRPFYIVDYIEGWIPGAYPPYHITGPIYEGTPEYRAKIWWNAIDTLAKIHTLDWKRTGFDFLDVPNAGTDPIDRQITFYEQMLRTSGETFPVILESTMEWLKENRFAPKRVSLCWGDARLGNLIYWEDKIVGALDWEMAFLGDPESDLAWFMDLHLNQYELVAKPGGHPPLEGLPGREETIEYYQQVTNTKVENYFYHDVFAIWRLAVISVRLQVALKAMGYPLPDIDLNRFTFERLRNLLHL